MNPWKTKKIGILGMGGSGKAAAALSLALGSETYCYDNNNNAPIVHKCHCAYGQNAELDPHLDMLIVSPGVPSENQFIRNAQNQGIEIIGELGFSSQFINIPILAITGTNGKSSTAYYLYQLLKEAGKRVFIGGNFGAPLSDLVLNQGNYDIAVIEVSSYQMERPGHFKPTVAAALNLTPDHLARHKTMRAYGEMKQRIFQRQSVSDYSIYPHNDDRLMPTGQGRQLQIGGTPGFQLNQSRIEIKGTPFDGSFDIACPDLLGDHNKENMAVAFVMCLCIGIDPTTLNPAHVKPLEHRLETIAYKKGARWVNDSKATNVEAALAGISGASPSQIVLLGGQGKEGANYQLLKNELIEKARQVICFGASGPQIAKALHELHPIVVNRMEEAIAKAYDLAAEKDTVLLSPACASFDAFQNYKARGDAFKEIVDQLESE